jgi:hypothetical protein
MIHINIMTWAFLSYSISSFVCICSMRCEVVDIFFVKGKNRRWQKKYGMVIDVFMAKEPPAV